MKQVESTTDISWFVLIAITSVIAGMALFAIVKNAVLRNQTESAWALAYEASQDDEGTVALQHIVVPPYIGDAVAAGQNVCGCPGCCQVLNG